MLKILSKNDKLKIHHKLPINYTTVFLFMNLNKIYAIKSGSYIV